VASVAQRGETRNTHVDAGRATIWHRLPDLVFGLNAHEPLAARLAHGDVLYLARHLTTVAVAQPAEPGQEDTAVALIGFDLLRVRVAETAQLSFLLKAREVRAPGEEIAVSPLQVPERLLQRMHWRIGQPGGLRAVAPPGEQLAQTRIAELLPATLAALFLQRQRLVEHEPARAGKAAHLPLLLAVWPQFVFAGLKSLHVSVILVVCQ